MKASVKTSDVAKTSEAELSVKPLYLESLTLVERLHRRLLDVIKDEFDRRGRSDINSVQALLLYNIGDAELSVQLHAAAVCDVHLGVGRRRRIAFDEQRPHTLAGQGQRQGEPDGPAAGDQYRDPVDRRGFDHR